MTQAFNPFSAPPAQAPVAQAPAPVAAQAAATLGSLDSPVMGGAPLLPHECDGQYRVQITGYSGGIGYESGHAVHITFKIVASTNPGFSPGQEFRIMYKYNWERRTPAPGKQGTVHRDLLSSFISALYKRPANDPSLNKVEEEAKLHLHDWAAQPGFVDLHCSSRPWTAPGSNVIEKRRRETWVAIPA